MFELCRIRYLMSQTWTAYSLVIMHKDVIYAVRDPYGNRPLCLGKMLNVNYFKNGFSELEILDYIVHVCKIVKSKGFA